MKTLPYPHRFPFSFPFRLPTLLFLFLVMAHPAFSAELPSRFKIELGYHNIIGKHLRRTYPLQDHTIEQWYPAEPVIGTSFYSDQYYVGWRRREAVNTRMRWTPASGVVPEHRWIESTVALRVRYILDKRSVHAKEYDKVFVLHLYDNYTKARVFRAIPITRFRFKPGIMDNKEIARKRKEEGKKKERKRVTGKW